MRLVSFTHTGSTFYVVPDHVTHLTDCGEYTRIHFISGEFIAVEGNVNSVGMKLQGR